MNRKSCRPTTAPGTALKSCLAAAFFSLTLAVPDVAQASVLHYTFNETGSLAPSTGTNTTAVTMRNDAGTAFDLHSADGLGVSGLPGDRAYANLGPNDHGSMASAATNGFRADQSDLGAIDQFGSFTLSGWFKTETTGTLVGKTPRLFWNHDGGAGSAGDGFNLQFFSGSEDLKLDVDDDTVSVNTTGGSFADKQTWVFFAVTYDGTLTTNNVSFYKGYSNNADALAGTTHANAQVKLISTHSLNRGAVDSETAGLVLGNRTGGDRPFDGYLDEMRVDGGAGNTGVRSLAELEAYRMLAVPEPGSLALALGGAAMFGAVAVRTKRKTRLNG